jgi:hypothetical protein
MKQTFIFSWKDNNQTAEHSVPIQAPSMMRAITEFRYRFPKIYKSKEPIKVERVED